MKMKDEEKIKIEIIGKRRMNGIWRNKEDLIEIEGKWKIRKGLKWKIKDRKEKGKGRVKINILKKKEDRIEKKKEESKSGKWKMDWKNKKRCKIEK